MGEGIEVGSSIGHYRIVSTIGAGGMGEVYLAHDARLDRNVAVKLLPADFARDEDRLRRFEQEAKATSALNHPNILTVYDIGEHEGSPFIVSELLEGEELRQRLDEGSIPLRRVTEYAGQIVAQPPTEFRDEHECTENSERDAARQIQNRGSRDEM